MSTLQVTYEGRSYTFAPGTTVRIGRSSENDIVISDPTVSRRHAQLSWDASGWVWQNAGQAPTFLAGQPVTQFSVGQQAVVNLAWPEGPLLQLTSAVAESDPAAAPGGPGAVHTNVAGQTPGHVTGQAPGYGAAAAAGAGFEGHQGHGGPPGWGQQGYQAGPAHGHHPSGYSGAPSGQGYPAQPVTPPGMQVYEGWQQGPPQAGIPWSQLDSGSFFETLIPIKSWLHDRGWRQGLRLLVIPYALLPLIFLGVFATSGHLSTPGWAYSLYIAPLWLLTFWYLIRPPHLGWLEVGIAGFIIVWTVIWLRAVTIFINTQVLHSHTLRGTKTLVGSLIVGYNEELSKAIPVLVAAVFLLVVRKKKLDPRTWFLMGTVAGLTFGVVEQSVYTPAAIVGIHSAHVVQQAVGDTLAFAFRVFVDGFQHAVWAGVSGFFIGMAVNYRRRRVPLLLLGISIPAILHALNDYTLTVLNTVWVAVLIQALSLLLFLGYTMSASTIERRVRRNPNFRGESIMMERFTEPEQASSS